MDSIVTKLPDQDGADEPANCHGVLVSTGAQETEPGPGHGEAVSEATRTNAADSADNEEQRGSGHQNDGSRGHGGHGNGDGIEWTDATWNPVTGCTQISPGCDHCYALTFAERFPGVAGHPYEQGFDLKLWPGRLSLPLT